MDNLLSSLLNLGVGGVMAAAVVMFLNHLVTKTIPLLLAEHRQERTEDRELNRAERAADREANRQHLANQQTVFERILTEIRSRDENAVEDLCHRLDALTDAIRQESRQMASAHETFVDASKSVRGPIIDDPAGEALAKERRSPTTSGTNQGRRKTDGPRDA